MQYQINGLPLLFNNGQLKVIKMLTGAADVLTHAGSMGSFEQMEVIYVSGRINAIQKNGDTYNLQAIEKEFGDLSPTESTKMVAEWAAIIYEKPKDQAITESEVEKLIDEKKD